MHSTPFIHPCDTDLDAPLRSSVIPADADTSPGLPARASASLPARTTGRPADRPARRPSPALPRPAVALLLAGLASAPALAADTSGFEGLADAPGSFHRGDPQPFPGGSTQFQSGFATFGHNAIEWGGGFSSWVGFAWSNVNDPTTAGFGNQYAARPGRGALGSETYVVGFLPAVAGGAGRTEQRAIGFDLPSLLGGAWFTNTTYAALSMLEGDAFTRPFSSTTGDFLELTIEGLSAGAVTGSLSLALADYRGPSPFVLSDWHFVDLSGLGWVDGLRFQLQGSDFGPFGLNTPAYFAMDELSRVAAVPLPAAVWGFVAALGLLGHRRRERRTPSA